MVTPTKFLALLVTYSSFFFTGFSFAQSSDEDKLVLLKFQNIHTLLTKLTGQVEIHEESLKLLATRADQSEINAAAAEAIRSDNENKQLVFINALLKRICEVEKNNCEVRERLAEIEEAYRRFHEDDYKRFQEEKERFKAEYERFLDERQRFQDQVQALSEGRQSHQSFYRGAPSSSDSGSNRRSAQDGNSINKERSILNVGHYPPLQQRRVHKIIRSRTQLCHSAAIIERCVDVRARDGNYYHGNLYRDCRGQNVLLIHRKTSSQSTR